MTALRPGVLVKPWRIGIDVGGTFTDLVLADASGTVRVFKAPSIPDAPEEGVLAVLDRAAGDLSLTIRQLLSDCAFFVHGSTVATNTLLEGKGAKVGLLVTEGFRDSLEIRRGIRADAWDHRRPNPPVLVPRSRRRPIRGRLDRTGQELVPLDMRALAEAARAFEKERVEAVAVCFFNSFRNGQHERAAAKTLSAALKGVSLSLSTEIAPIVGEYERSSTTVVNAYVAPRTGGYLRSLAGRLKDLGLPGPVFVVQSSGGVLPIEQACDKPVFLVLSGPAAGAGALVFHAPLLGTGDLILMEIGGTSCDVTVMNGGKVATSEAMEIGGYHVATPSVEIHTVGAGGGTIAGLDPGGMLFVGPEGAGARPGPACYGLGGTRPTVTDAQVVLGRLRAGYYAGCRLSIDAGRARTAIEREIAQPLGIAAEAAAFGIVSLLKQRLLHAVQRLSIERGHDPRRFTLVAAGGAGPMYAAAIGRRLGCARVYVPRRAGAFCAFGMIQAPLRHDFAQSVYGPLEEIVPQALPGLFGPLEEKARNSMPDGEELELERLIDLRYTGQQMPLTVPIEDHDVVVLRRRFEHEHARLYGQCQPEATVEVCTIRIVAVHPTPPLPVPPLGGMDQPPNPIQQRTVYLDRARGFQPIAIYADADLRPGHAVFGPLIIESETTTVFVNDADMVTVDRAGNYIIELTREKSATRGEERPWSGMMQ